MLLPVYVLAASKTIFGRRASIWAAIRFTTSRWSLYLKMAFLILCAELIIPELLAALATLGTLFVLDKMGLLEGSSGFFPVGAIIFAGIVGGLLLFFWITAGIAFAVPAAVLEELSGTRALRRSWELTKGSRWRIVGAWLAVAVLAVLMSLITVLLLRLAVYICYYNWHWRWFNLPVYQQLVNVLNAAITSFLGPVYPIAVTLLYYEQRSRKEGFDVELMLEQAGLGTGDSAAIRILRSTEGEFVEAEESGWSRFMKFIRSLRGFD
jgi:hypothetical protein